MKNARSTFLQVPITREEVSEIAREIRAEAERFGRERDREGTVFFEVRNRMSIIQNIGRMKEPRRCRETSPPQCLSRPADPPSRLPPSTPTTKPTIIVLPGSKNSDVSIVKRVVLVARYVVTMVV